jgi:outer membrane protein TolC
MSISQTRVDLSQRKLEIGLGTKPEYLQSQVDLNAQKAARIAQESYIGQLKVSLNQIINRAPSDSQNDMSTDYDVSDTIPIQVDLSLEEIQRNFDETNPLLQITQKNMDIAQFSLKEVKAERYPTVQFNSAYNFNKTNNDVALNPALPLFNRNRGLNYGFTATIPILNYRTTHRRIQQAMLNIEYQSLLYNSQRSRLRLNVINAYKDFEMQKRALELEEDNILLAKENVSIVLETYRLGSATFIQLREAEKSLEDAYNRLINARYNTKLAETSLLRMKGELVK